VSYLPRAENARIAYNALVKQDRPWPGYVYPDDVDLDALREVLIAIACPIPCDGVVQGEGWHKLCEKYADEALEALCPTLPDRSPQGSES
jgi:hypothetical protein